ncbi:MAG: dipeptidyl-peptidase 5 [Planctomycetota bacterium]
MAKRLLQPEDLWTIPRVGKACLAPDGTRFIVPVTTHDIEKNKAMTRLWLHEPDRRPRALTGEDASASSPAWSPDGTRVAFVRTPEEGKPQIHVLPLDGGEAEAVTACEEGAADPRWCPDSKRIVFLLSVRIHERDERAFVSEDRVPRFWDSWLTDGLRWHLALVDTTSRTVTDLMPKSKVRFGLQTPSGEWDLSPDGKELVYGAMVSAPKAPLQGGVFRMRIGAKPQRIESPGWDAWRPRYSPDGKQIVFGWDDDRESWASRTKLALWDRGSGKVTPLAPRWTLSPSEFAWHGKQILCLADIDGRVGLFRVPRRGAPVELRRGGSLAGLDGAGSRVFLQHSSVKQPWEVYSCAQNGSDWRRETRHTAKNMRAVQLGRVEDVRFAGARGARVQMFLVHPPKPKKKPPLLHLIHGGPHGSFGDIWHARWCAQVFAAQGYLCALVNFHGSIGWGEEFASSIVGEWGDRPYEDIMAATDWLIEHRNVDEKKMAVSGGSYGGYLTSWITTQTKRFACAINHAGVCDLQTQYGCEIPQAWGKQAGEDIWKDADAFDRYNPMRHVGKIRTPTLILHGEQDYRVPYIQALQLYNILQLRKVPCRIAIYPDENHWILKPKNSVHWYGEFFGWLKRWM